MNIKKQYIENPEAFKRRETKIGIDSNSQSTAIACFYNNFGHAVAIKELADQYNSNRKSDLYQKLDCISLVGLRNWSAQGYVPLEYAFRLAMLFEIDPAVLNYTGVSLCSLEMKKWKEVINECYIYTPEQKQLILSRPEYPQPL